MLLHPLRGSPFPEGAHVWVFILQQALLMFRIYPIFKTAFTTLPAFVSAKA